MKFYRLIPILGLLCMSLAHAETHYIRAGATGANNGSDWTNAWTALPAQLVRGDTYYIGGGTYGPYNFNTAVSGETYIYIKKATTTDHGTSTGWNYTYGTNEAVFESDEETPITFSTSYIDMDGQLGSDEGGYGFRIHAEDKVSYAVLVQDTTWSYSTLSHIKLQHCNIHHRGADVFIPEGEFTAAGTGDKIIVPDASRYNANGTDRIKLATTGTLPSGLVAGSGYTGQEYYVRNIDTQNNTVQLYDVSNPSSPITGMNAGTGTHTFFLRKGSRGFQVSSMANMANSLISHCYIHDMPSTLVYLTNDSHDNVIEYCTFSRNHSDSVSSSSGIQGYHNSTRSTDDNIIRYCKFEDIEGGGMVVACDGWKIYGNVFSYTGNFPNPGQAGGYSTSLVAYGTGNHFYNNTIYGKRSGSYGITLFYDTSGTNYVKNNIWANCGGHMAWQAGVEYDYNVYYDMRDNWATNYLANLETNEPHSEVITTDPFEDATAWDFRLAATLPYGLELAAPYNVDMAGMPRGAIDAWDVGAYEYVPYGQTHYVRAGATGNNDGSDWTNAWTALPAQLVRGDVYYIADGEYDPYNFTTPVSGELYIYVKKATINDHGTNTGWNNAYGDGEALFESSTTYPLIFSTGFIDMDGQVGSGESGYGFRVHALDKVSYTVLVQDPTYSYKTISNIKLRYCNIHHRGAEPFISEGEFTVAAGGDRIIVADASRYGTGGWDQVRLETTGTMPSGLVESEGYSGQEYYVRNRDLQNNTVQLYTVSSTPTLVTGMNAGTGTHTIYQRRAHRGFQVASTANLAHSVISHCYIHDVPSVNIYLTGQSHHNVVEHSRVARDHSDPYSHAEAIQSGSLTTNDNIVRYNIFEDIEGTAVIVACHNWRIYGNVMFWTDNYPNPGQKGGCAAPIFAHGVGNHFYNNTIYGKHDGSYGITYFYDTVGPNYVKNNIWANCSSHMSWQASVVYDYNVYYDMEGGHWDDYLAVRMATNEPHSVVITSDPFEDAENYDFHLDTALAHGLEMFDPFDMDMDDNERGEDDGWDVGAYEFVQEE